MHRQAQFSAEDRQRAAEALRDTLATQGGIDSEDFDDVLMNSAVRAVVAALFPNKEV